MRPKTAQEKVLKFIDENHFVVMQGAVWVPAGPVKLGDVAIARALGVDRRIVKRAILSRRDAQ